KEKKFEQSDICLFVEGSYPYVRGGVSSWVHEQIKYFKDLTFSVVHMVSSSSEIKEFKYDLPGNILYYKDIYLYDLPDIKRKGKNKKSVHLMDLMFDFIISSATSDKDRFKHLCNELGVMDDFQLDTGDLFFSPQAWKFITKLYNQSLSDVPFLEYIWAYRSLVLPLYNVLRSTYPPASLFYTVLTGYAGLGATISSQYYNKPLMITEHGIYHRERMIEINQANWIYEVKQDGYTAREVFTGLKKVWIDLYLTLSSLIYNHASTVTTLFTDNARMEIEAGADPGKIVIIPNGIDMNRFSSVKQKGLNKDILTVALVGRVVPIKDIKTYILAARLVCDEMKKKVKFLVMGPYDEDKEYSDECITLVNLVGLDGSVEFTGNVDLTEAFNNVDLVVLTSISEGQPLTLMEAMSAGIPCVATNVGCCRELLYGKDNEDEMLGKCGLITNVHAPTETAGAIMTILKDGRLYQRMAHTGKIRMERYYQKKDVLERYGEEFKKLLNSE
ncbi:MAG: GT4 family glycosyltransferase PelF, partial [Candidatus Eremiobacterota bacterium]